MKNRIFAVVLVVAVVLLAVLWNMQHTNKVQRDRMNARFEKEKKEVELRLYLIGLKADALKTQMGFVEIENYVKTLEGWNK